MRRLSEGRELQGEKQRTRSYLHTGFLSKVCGSFTFFLLFSSFQLLRELGFFVLFQLNSVQSFSHVWLFATPWPPARQASLSITNSRSPPKSMSIESVMPSNQLIPLSSPSPPALNPSQHQGLFQWVSSSHQVTKVLDFQLQHQSLQWTPRTDLL